MSEIVFVLGAGTSSEAGAPVVANFLDKAEELVRLGKLGEYIEDFKRVFDARSKLQIAHSKTGLNLDNIESVFAAFEMGRLINRLPGIKTDDIEPLLVSMKRLICKTLEQTINYPIRDKSICPSNSYNSFAESVKDLVMEGHSCSIITFNYDYALDFALNFNNIPPNYCLPAWFEDSKNAGVIPLLKLHGSLNWTKCLKCGQVIPLDIRDYLAKSNASLVTHVMPGPIHINLVDSLAKSGLKHSGCSETVDGEPVIVPPTWNKTEHQQILSTVWRHAASELSTAENVFVSGYSLSESDLFFRYLFALGSIGDNMIKRFWVFDLDNEGKVDRRFQELIGTQIKARYLYQRRPFSEAIDIIRGQFIKR